MTTRPNTNSRMNFAPSKRTFVKSVDDDDECQQIYKKLERLQPNGVCVNLETLRRALHPPLAIAKNRNEQILLLGSFYGQRNHFSLPPVRNLHTSSTKKVYPPIACYNLDRIINQVNKHAAINYSYYTRTK